MTLLCSMLFLCGEGSGGGRGKGRQVEERGEVGLRHFTSRKNSVDQEVNTIEHSIEDHDFLRIGVSSPMRTKNVESTVGL